MLGVLLAFAYPDRIAKLRSDKSSTYLLSNAKGATLHQQDELFNTGFLVIADLDAKHTNATIYKALAISHTQIEDVPGRTTQTPMKMSHGTKNRNVLKHEESSK